MEYVIVTYPTRRLVYIDDRAGGYTNEVADLVVIAVNAATAPLDNYSFDTVELLRRTVDDFNGDAQVVAGCNRLSAAKGAQCALRLPAPFSVGFFPVQVAFQYERDPAERAWLAKQPTTLSLPRASVDRLLAEDPQFRRLLEAPDGCLAPAAGAC
jgi:NTE family protein